MLQECKNSWDYLKIIAKYDSNPGDSPETTMRNKTTEFLTDAAERIIIMTKVYLRIILTIMIIIMTKVYSRIMKRFHVFLAWLGIPKHLFSDYRVHQVTQCTLAM